LGENEVVRCGKGVVVAAILVACTNTSTTAPAPAPFQEGIDLASAQELLDHGGAATQFDLSTVSTLWVRVKLHAAAGVVAVRLNFVGPQGGSVFETSLQFTTDASYRAMPGTPSLFVARPLAGGFGLDYPIPIAGTVFTRFPKPGAWTVEATIGGKQKLTTPMTVVFSR
jgi:hypothetical protein